MLSGARRGLQGLSPLSSKDELDRFSDCLVRESGDPNGRKEFLHLERLQRMATMRESCKTDAAKASGSLQDYIAIELAAMSVGMKAC